MIYPDQNAGLWVFRRANIGDVAGRTTEAIDANTGEIIPVRIFVAVLGAGGLSASLVA